MADSPIRGRFVWHELMSSDPQAEGRFYKDVVGWTPQPWDKNPSYTVMMSGGRMMAGMMARPDPGAPTHWLSYISTPNVEATARQVIELGGKVLKPATDIPDIGRFAILQDPQGAVFAGFTPKPGATPPAGDAKTSLGDFSWHELITTDWKSALTFYQTLFGWEKMDSMETGPGNTYQMFGSTGKMLGGMFNKPGPPMWLPYALVPDAKKVVDIVTRTGGKVINGPMEVPGGDWITQILDPQGVMFAVHSKKPAAAAAPAAKRKTAPAKKSAAARKPKRAKKSKPAKKPKPVKKKTTRSRKRGKRR
jgi:uncharacterized protein